MAGSAHNENVQISTISALPSGLFPRIFSRDGIFLLAYTLSGVVALAYQVLWIRLLSLQFGVSVFSVATTAAAFMLGLGGGGLIGSYWVARLRRPLLVIAIIEAAVAAFALTLPLFHIPLQALTDSVAQQGSLTPWYVAQGLTTLLVLAIPTTAMGFGFALVLQAARARDVSFATIYGCNAAGGAIGALVPLVTLPLFGWATSNLSVALAGIGVALMFAWMSVRFESSSLPSSPAFEPLTAENLRTHAIPAKFWFGYGVIGFGAILLEVSWVRLYGMIFLRTEYVVAIILSIFLLGIGLGSIFARGAWVRSSLRWFPLLVPLSALISAWALVPISRWIQSANYFSFADVVVTQGLALLIVTLPTTLLLGAWYPSLVMTTRGAGPRQGAWLYGVNCLGGVLGALALPGLLSLVGTSACIVLAAVFICVGGVLTVRPRRMWAGLPLVVGVAAPVWTMPAAHTLMPATLGDTETLFVHEDALAITHVVKRADGERLLLSDLQRMDASTDAAAVAAQMNQLRLPLLLVPQAESVLLLGLGTGISTIPTQAAPGLNITAVELAQGAIDAARGYFAPLNSAALSNVDIVRDDARRFLQRTAARYDIIVGDLFHPDLVGRSTLLTVQQFERARRRLSEEGIFVQWMALNQFDVMALEAVVRAFAQVFPNGSLYLDGFRLALVSRGPTKAQTLLDGIDRLAPQQQSLLTGNEGGWTWLGRYWSGVSGLPPGPVQDEWQPQVEFSLPRAKYNGHLNLPEVIAWLLARRTSPERARTLFAIRPQDKEIFERAYLTTEVAARSWYAGLTGREDESIRLLRTAFDGNPLDRWVAYQLADQMWQSLPAVTAQGISPEVALERILRIAPDHLPALRARWAKARAEGQSQLQQQLGERIAQLDPFGPQR